MPIRRDRFLQVCLDQVTFMSSLFDLENLGRRLTAYVALFPEPYADTAD